MEDPRKDDASNANKEPKPRGGHTEVNITESEDKNPNADVNPGRTPGKAEGVEDPEVAGNE
jgi:hypothetical protein